MTIFILYNIRWKYLIIPEKLTDSEFEYYRKIFNQSKKQKNK